ncbi:hypothetical protein [Neobacillus cucumis]|uniref:hypothetical protein n=1 Tax=Neobacillus cucumis TaxID=1740721 RepID=UPI0028533A7D|nr:hypothetical protein [Neobacillus cucumis]MDR4947893.1 hypothetical protein [Neobacillus cucumis]
MDLYEKLPIEVLISFYNEIKNNIEKGILTKKMYYEIGIIISVAKLKGLILEFPSDFNEEVNEVILKDLSRTQKVKTGYISYFCKSN